ncbi:MAG: hypothetical protein A3J88_01470 [Melioribacter sp. RIFOXYB12_FULL_38_5]|nr:MAG: hypothetical protein A3J88_01470 [Melioribacter sp. RIFOXYB12_FULL_38_5]
MILVSIYIKEEKLFIEVKHKKIYQVEKEFHVKKDQNPSNVFLFTQLFVSIIKLGAKELFEFVKPVKRSTKIPQIPVSYIEGK